MKKLLTLLTAIFISFNAVIAAEEIVQPSDKTCRSQERMQREAAFEKRLGLTDEQKVKARELRIKGHEKMKPIMDEIIAKKQEARMVKLSRISVQMQEEKLAKIDAELKVLEKRARTIRSQNMKEFEKILTGNQRKILKQMKKEGRQRYHTEHPSARPVVQHPCKI